MAEVHRASHRRDGTCLQAESAIEAVYKEVNGVYNGGINQGERMPRIKTNGDGAVWDPNDDYDEYIEELTRVCRNNDNVEEKDKCVLGPDPQPLSAFRKGGYGSRNWTCTACFVRKKTGKGIEGDLVPIESSTKKIISTHGNSRTFKQMIKEANEGRDVIKTKAPSVD